MVKFVKIKIGNINYNVTDTSGNGSWYSWEYDWDTTRYRNEQVTILFVVFDGSCYGYIEFKLKIDNEGNFEIIEEPLPPGTEELPDTRNPPKTVDEEPIGIITISITIIAVSMFVIFGFVMETGRYKLLTVFFVPLHVKLHKDKVLENFARGEIYGFIRSNPGTYFNHIKLALRLNNGTLAYHLRVLERDSLIHSQTDGVFRRFYPEKARLPRTENGGDRVHSFVQLNSTQDQIVNIIRNNPGITQKEIAKLMGKSTQVISYNIKIMAELGLVKLERKGKWTKCFISGIHRIDESAEVVWDD
jgi:predicted transcriptional regulator